MTCRVGASTAALLEIDDGSGVLAGLGVAKPATETLVGAVLERLAGKKSG